MRKQNLLFLAMLVSLSCFPAIGSNNKKSIDWNNYCVRDDLVERVEVFFKDEFKSRDLKEDRARGLRRFLLQEIKNVLNEVEQLDGEKYEDAVVVLTAAQKTLQHLDHHNKQDLKFKR